MGWEPKAHRKRIFRESFHSAKGQVHVVYPMKQFHNISNKSGQHSISLSIIKYFFSSSHSNGTAFAHCCFELLKKDSSSESPIFIFLSNRTNSTSSAARSNYG